MHSDLRGNFLRLNGVNLKRWMINSRLAIVEQGLGLLHLVCLLIHLGEGFTRLIIKVVVLAMRSHGKWSLLKDISG